MENKKEDIFTQVQNLINQGEEDEYRKVQLEVAAQVDTDKTGHNTIYPGIQINVPGFDMPIFIAVEELRQLADASEKYFQDMYAKKDQAAKLEPKKTKVKK